MPVLSSITSQHLEKIRQFYDKEPTTLGRTTGFYRDLLAHYYNLLIPSNASVLEIGCGSGELLARLKAHYKVGIDLSPNQINAARAHLPGAKFFVQAGETIDLAEKFDYIIISDTLNYAADVQAMLERLHKVAHSQTRLLINYHSSLWRPILSLAGVLSLKSRHPLSSWLTTSDVRNLLHLSDWSPLTIQPRILFPTKCLGIEKLFNRWFSPFLSWFCLTIYCVARPTRLEKWPPLSVSVIIPARNEAGNISDAISRTPEMGSGTELIFVEGHSRDNTWAEIQRIASENKHRKIKILQQSGHGKGDAVRQGFSVATGDLLMILDADLTMPPEELPKFYEVIASGRGEFANGVRLVYPMGDKAMQFLNLCANKTFGIMFSWLLGQPVKDTLCGTKVLSRQNYEKIAANRGYFGEFDPFGDFDLLFGAAKLNLKITDVPIRYCDRTYGTTNIHRWRHGWLLMRMIVFAAQKLKFV